MRFAGISKAYFVLRTGKWDIPAYFGDGSALDMQLAYLVLNSSFGVPFTLDHAYPFVRHATVAFGFPDILFDSPAAFARLLERNSGDYADIILGLFPATHPFSKEDRVNFDDAGRVSSLILRPAKSHVRYSWAIPKYLSYPLGTRFKEPLKPVYGSQGSSSLKSPIPILEHLKV
jgi:glucose-1-phosphate thymidylyltransferase